MGQPYTGSSKERRKVDANSNASNKNNGKFNLRLCIDYRKLNSRIQTVHQIKVDGSLGTVISNYPLPTLGSILTHFNGCKFFSTIDLRSDCYHIRLTMEAAEKTAFVNDKGKWIFHSLPLVLILGPQPFLMF